MIKGVLDKDLENQRMGARIRLFREKKGWSQTELAKKMGITQQSVALYESGRRNIKSNTVSEIAQILGIEANKIMHDPNEIKEVEDIEKRIHREQVKLLNDLYNIFTRSSFMIKCEDDSLEHEIIKNQDIVIFSRTEDIGSDIIAKRTKINNEYRTVIASRNGVPEQNIAGYLIGVIRQTNNQIMLI